MNRVDQTVGDDPYAGMRLPMASGVFVGQGATPSVHDHFGAFGQLCQMVDDAGPGGGRSVPGLGAADVTQFVVTICNHLGTLPVEKKATALYSLL